MFANPYVLLAALALAIGLFGSGVSVGYKWENRAHAAAVLDAQNAAIDAANRDVEAATARAVAQAKAEAAARLSATTIRLKGERDAAIKARPECTRDADSIRLLVESIDSANGQTPSTSGMSDRVPTSPDSR